MKPFNLVLFFSLISASEQKIQLPSELILQQKLVLNKMGILNNVSEKLGNQCLTPIEIEKKVRKVLVNEQCIKSILDSELSPLILSDIDDYLIKIILEDRLAAAQNQKKQKLTQ
jgi:hypothetical protein